MKMQSKIIGAAAGWIIAISLLIIFLIIPACLDIVNARSKLQEQNSLIAANKARADQITRFKQYLNNSEAALAELNNSYVNAKNPTAFITFLNQTAAVSNASMKILSTAFKEQNNNSEQSFLEFQIKLSGDFAAIARFIKIIESGIYLVNITNVSMTSANEILPSASLNVGNSSNLDLLPPGEISALITLMVGTNNEKK